MHSDMIFIGWEERRDALGSLVRCRIYWHTVLKREFVFDEH